VLGVLNLFVPEGHQSTDIGVRFVTAIADTLAGIIRRRRAEEQSRAHQAELAHVTRLSTVGEMATGIAHEVNQPLTAMVTASQACLRMTESGTVDFDKVRETMREVATQGLRAGEIIRHLREFTRMRETKRTTVDPNDLVQEAARFVEAEALENGINMKLELGAELPRVVVDAIQVEQVILNLLRNAIEAMEGTAADQHLLTVQTRKNKAGMVELLVSDTGPGLSEETASRIFDAFFTTKSHGMGMGLSISRSIIEAHKGCLWADGLLGDGATFHFTLPSASQGNCVDH
jgi:C4-dicarboxylate-specific signal transduction histidine kinase